MFIAILTLLSALSISGVAIFYSVIGLATIFPGAFVPVVIMGGVLEVGKLITASWLYRNWKFTPFMLKTYLTTAVIVLSLITSMGIFGFLSKAHLEQNLASDTLIQRIQILEDKIESEKNSILRQNAVIDRLEKSIGGVTEMGGLPDALFIIDVKRESIAVSEASKMGIPIVGIVDSNSNPEGIDYVVPGNDDSIRSIALFTEAVADACMKGSDAATGLKQEEPQSGPAIVRKVETNELVDDKTEIVAETKETKIEEETPETPETSETAETQELSVEEESDATNSEETTDETKNED